MKSNLTNTTILKVLGKNIMMTLAVFVVVIAVVILSIIPPQLLKIIIDINIVPKNYEGLERLVFGYMGVLIFIGLFDFLKASLLTILGQKIMKNLRMELIQKLERIGSVYFSINSTGSIASRLTVDVENVNSLFSNGVISMIIDCFKIIGIVISIWIFSPELGVATLCVVPFIYLVARAFQKRMLQAQIKNLVQLGRVNTHISESINNIQMIKSFGKVAYMENIFKKRLEDNFHTVERVNFYDSCYAPIIQMVRAVIIACIVLLSSDGFNFLGISIGMLAASIELISNLFRPIETLGMELQNIQKGISGIRRIDDFYLEHEEAQKCSTITAQKLLGANQNVHLIFEDVSFSYLPNHPILNNLTLDIKKGNCVTFAGRTGVGKSTLFRLIMGLLNATSGKILLNDVDVYEIPNSEKRQIFGYVEQQFNFINGSIAMQISLGDDNISHEQVEKAMKFVGLHICVSNMENGYDTIVNLNETFSQGQKQLLAIARAIVTNPPILLLDEVTSNLDTVTEANIINVLQKAQCGRTMLSISHRMTSVLTNNTVITLDDGELCSK